MTSTSDARDLAARIAAFAAPEQRLNEQERAKVRVVVADAVAQALMLTTRRPADGDAGAVARTVARLTTHAERGPATVIGLRRGVDVGETVLINSAAIHARLTDDADPAALAHPAAVVVPVALALGEEVDADAESFSAAVAAGYRTMGALAAPVAERIAARGLRNTAVFGPAAAAMTAARILGLDERRRIAALQFALGSSGGSLQALRTGSGEWRLQPGMAARIGVTAARLARSVDEADLAFGEGAVEGAHGFYASLLDGWDAGDAQPSGDGLLRVTHKIHATCGANQLAVESIATLRRRLGWHPDDIAHVDIELEPAGYAYPGCNSRGPFAPGGGFLSRPLAVAAVLLTRDRVLSDATISAALADPRVDALMAKVHSRSRIGGTPRHPQAAVVTVTTSDGVEHRDDGSGALAAFVLPDMSRRLADLDDPARARSIVVWDALQSSSTSSPRQLAAILTL